MSRNKELLKVLTLRVSPDQFEKLEKYASKKGCSLAHLLRGVISSCLDELKRCGEI